MRGSAKYIAAGKRDISKVKWISKYPQATKTVLTGLCRRALHFQTNTCQHEPCSAVSLTLRGSPLSAPNACHIFTNYSVRDVIFWTHHVLRYATNSHVLRALVHFDVVQGRLEVARRLFVVNA